MTAHRVQVSIKFTGKPKIMTKVSRTTIPPGDQQGVENPEIGIAAAFGMDPEQLKSRYIQSESLHFDMKFKGLSET